MRRLASLGTAAFTATALGFATPASDQECTAKIVDIDAKSGVVRVFGVNS